MNGEKVIEVKPDEDWIDTRNEIFFQNDIEYIVSKEQFEVMKYIVGDENNAKN